MTLHTRHPRRPRRTAVAAIAVGAAAAAASAGTLLAASAGTSDSAFAQNGSGLNGTVEAIALQSDGRIVVGGSFTAYNDTSRPRVARLTTTGALDTSFVPTAGGGLDGAVNALLVQPDGDILAGGSFVRFGNTLSRALVRLNADGTLDAGFDVASGFTLNGGATATVEALAAIDASRVLAGGNFDAYKGSAQFHLIGLTASAVKYTGVGFGANFIAGGAVRAIAPDPTGGFALGGDFTSVDGATSWRGIARLTANASPHKAFSPTTGFDGSVRAVAVQSDGKIIAGGTFTAYNGVARTRLARINPDGSLDASFSVGGGFNGAVEAIAVQPDGKVVVGGTFTTYDGVSRPRIARLNPDGSLDTSFAPGTGFSAGVTSVGLQANGGVLVGGSFQQYAGATASRLARLLGSATADAAPGGATGGAAGAAGGAAPTATVGRSGVARVKSGTVQVRLPGTATFVRLDNGVLSSLPVGSQVDTRTGSVAIRIREGGTAGPTREVVVSKGVFTFQQNFRKGKPTLTDIRLSQPLACGASKSEAAGTKKPLPRTRSRAVRVSVGKTTARRKRGVVRTRSRYITGTARGTVWGASDTCRYSRVKVFRGVVAVRSLITRRTVNVRAKRVYIVRTR